MGKKKKKLCYSVVWSCSEVFKVLGGKWQHAVDFQKWTFQKWTFWTCGSVVKYLRCWVANGSTPPPPQLAGLP